MTCRHLDAYMWRSTCLHPDLQQALPFDPVKGSQSRAPDVEDAIGVCQLRLHDFGATKEQREDRRGALALFAILAVQALIVFAIAKALT